jgi:hypothetical protein
MEKLPNWLRWILIPFASLLASFLLNAFLELTILWNSQFIGFGGEFFELAQRNTFNAGLVGFAMVYAGVYLAPSKKEIVSLVLGAIWVLIGSMSIWIGISKGDYWVITNIISTIIGIGAAIYNAFNENMAGNNNFE